MPIYYGGKKLQSLYYGGKKIASAWYGGKCVYRSGLPVGTVLWSGNLYVNVQSLVINVVVPGGVDSLPTGIAIHWETSGNSITQVPKGTSSSSVRLGKSNSWYRYSVTDSNTIQLLFGQLLFGASEGQSPSITKITAY